MCVTSRLVFPKLPSSSPCVPAHHHSVTRTPWAHWHHVKAALVLRAWCWAPQGQTEPTNPNSRPPCCGCVHLSRHIWVMKCRREGWNSQGVDCPPHHFPASLQCWWPWAGLEQSLGKEERSAKEEDKILRRDAVLTFENMAAGGNASPPQHLLQGWGQQHSQYRILGNLKYFWTSKINFSLDSLA